MHILDTLGVMDRLRGKPATAIYNARMCLHAAKEQSRHLAIISSSAIGTVVQMQWSRTLWYVK
jgi:hypothetical protein